METNIIQIDVSKLDAEIKELETVLKVKIEFRQSLNKYIVANAVKAASPLVDSVLPSITNQMVVQNDSGISDFIKNYVKYQKFADSRQIIQAYADYKHAKYVDVRNNVSNALSRLKKAGQLHTRVKADGSGSEFFIKEKGLETSNP